MPLIPTQLANALANDWLAPDGGPWPASVSGSADAFAAAVSDWFAAAQAGGFPCTTASARRGQLMAASIPALEARDAFAAGRQLAMAFSGYVAGQNFGSGVAAPPLATAAAGPLIGQAFANLEQPRQARAASIAGALHMMALSSIVSFAAPPMASPIV